MSQTDPPDDYINFELSIWAEGANYFARVDSPAGNTTQKVPLKLFDTVAEAENMRLRVENALLREASNVRGSPEERILKDFGERVFDKVFCNNEIATLYAMNNGVLERDRLKGLRVKLRIDARDLAELPWEYLYNNSADEFLAQNYKSPIIRCPDVQHIGQALEVDGPLNILGMIANPGGVWKHIDAEKERGRIEAAIKPHRETGRINFQWVTGDTPEQLITTMSKGSWHVFHFIGHGGTLPPGPDTRPDVTPLPEGFIVFANGQGGAIQKTGRELKVMLQNPSLRLVVLNCCESARGASPAAALLRYGIPAVVAMQFPISDEAAIRLSGAFYDSLAADQPLEWALTTARIMMLQISPTEWGIPVLFMRSKTGRLFRRTQAPTAPAPRLSEGAKVDGRRAAARERLRELFNE